MPSRRSPDANTAKEMRKVKSERDSRAGGRSDFHCCGSLAIRSHGDWPISEDGLRLGGSGRHLNGTSGKWLDLLMQVLFCILQIWYRPRSKAIDQISVQTSCS